MMKIKKTTTSISLIATLFSVILPFGSATAGEALTVQNHVQIAKHHEALLKKAETKLKEHQAALEDYESRSYYYGRGGQDFQSHETANIHEYENMVAKNKAHAALHYKLASKSQTPRFISSSLSISNIQIN